MMFFVPMGIGFALALVYLYFEWASQEVDATKIVKANPKLSFLHVFDGVSIDVWLLLACFILIVVLLFVFALLSLSSNLYWMAVWGSR